MPNPNHTTTIGASATFGTELSATSSGENIRSTIFEPTISNAIGTPAPMDTTNPKTASCTVTSACSSR